MLIPPAVVNDPLQRPRLKIQFAFCLGVRCASHLSAVVNRIGATRFQSILNRYLRRWWSIQPLANAGSHSRTAKG